MREPAHDYLSNMLNYISSNLDSLVPFYILGMQTSTIESPLATLFTKIVKTGEVDFFADSMLDQLC